MELLEKVLAFSLKLDLLFPQELAEEVVLCVFKKKRHILSWNCNIFLSGGTVRKKFCLNYILSGGVFGKYLSILFKTVFVVFPLVTC